MKKTGSKKKTVKVPEMESLPDPKNDRQIKDIKPPVNKPLSDSLLYNHSKYMFKS
jgi:hypothetical protein